MQVPIVGKYPVTAPQLALEGVVFSSSPGPGSLADM
jgi:hypothetical protein